MRSHRALTILTGTILAVGALSAQTRQPPSGGNTGSGGTTGGISNGNLGSINSTTNPNSSTSTSTNNNPDLSSRPIMISGKVQLQDGSPPPESLRIERVCGGRAQGQGYTDQKGNFSFTLGSTQGVISDASDGPVSSARLSNPNSITSQQSQRMTMNCDIRAVLAGYRSDVISLSGQRYMDNADIGTIILHRQGNVDGLTISATSALAPKDAQKAYAKGIELLKKAKYEDAQNNFYKATDLYPRYAAAWYELGHMFEQQERDLEAREAFNKAIAADSKFTKPYEGLYMVAFRAGRWQELADVTDKVVRLNPYDFPYAHYYNAVANMQLKKYDIAEKSAREAYRIDTSGQNPKTKYVLGLILARKQEFKESAEFLRAYLQTGPEASEKTSAAKVLADVEKYTQAKASPELDQ